jgi:hypothetical protein
MDFSLSFAYHKKRWVIILATKKYHKRERLPSLEFRQNVF